MLQKTGKREMRTANRVGQQDVTWLGLTLVQVTVTWRHVCLLSLIRLSDGIYRVLSSQCTVLSFFWSLRASTNTGRVHNTEFIRTKLYTSDISFVYEFVEDKEAIWPHGPELSRCFSTRR
jgi:hypothetical protein